MRYKQLNQGGEEPVAKNFWWILLQGEKDFFRLFLNLSSALTIVSSP
jgi:hypothetical protein